MIIIKTFKMLSLELLEENQFTSYPLIDGIIINQENSHKYWILEMYMDAQYADDFAKYLGTDDILDVRAVISYPDNEPAYFRVVVHNITEMPDTGHVSVLLKGTLNSNRRQYAEQLLLELVEEGLTGNVLLERFKSDLHNRKKLK
ncbi:YwpF family protein [Rummeliibacillus stabekisii]|uniref:YwpF family protein n=1 Tax=Rummeliibacillus stabekisii TaxID=241244 RepID=UPI001171D049|nr:YwpF family protein [Rummeliibacillus stabekisii]MBB5170475.1 hypothetical protein [Rummeliibacillus stabekisii]GEL04729.1 hypothetical protein RST01_13560 [Rummeliibacillus stabekisii]